MQAPGQELHGEALAGALGVPDHTTALVAFPAGHSPAATGTQPGDDLLRRPVLLVAADHLGRPGLGVPAPPRSGSPVAAERHLEDVVPDDVEHIAGFEDDRGQLLLQSGMFSSSEEPPATQLSAERRRILVVRGDAAPERVVLLGGGVRTEGRVGAIGGHQQLHGREEVRYATKSARSPAGVVADRASGIGTQVTDGFAERVPYVRRLALDDHKRDAVHEQDEVQHGRLAVRVADPQLVDDEIVVTVQDFVPAAFQRLVRPVDERRLHVPVVRAGMQDAVQQEFGRVPVGWAATEPTHDGRPTAVR